MLFGGEVGIDCDGDEIHFSVSYKWVGRSGSLKTHFLFQAAFACLGSLKTAYAANSFSLATKRAPWFSASSRCALILASSSRAE